MSTVLDNIYINLRVIAKIPEGGKISTTSPGQVTLEDTNNRATRIWRTLTRDSRKKSVKLLMGLANDITEISDNIISSLYYTHQYENDKPSMFQLNDNAKKIHQLKKLVRELQNSVPGFNNLLNTYRKDLNVTAGIEEIVDKVNIQITKIQNTLRMMNQSEEGEDLSTTMLTVLNTAKNIDAIQHISASPPKDNRNHSRDRDTRDAKNNQSPHPQSQSPRDSKFIVSTSPVQKSSQSNVYDSEHSISLDPFDD